MTIKKNVPVFCTGTFLEIIFICLATEGAAAMEGAVVMADGEAMADVNPCAFPALAAVVAHDAHTVSHNRACNADDGLCNIYDELYASCEYPDDPAVPESQSYQK